MLDGIIKLLTFIILIIVLFLAKENLDSKTESNLDTEESIELENPDLFISAKNIKPIKKDKRNHLDNIYSEGQINNPELPKLVKSNPINDIPISNVMKKVHVEPEPAPIVKEKEVIIDEIDSNPEIIDVSLGSDEKRDTPQSFIDEHTKITINSPSEIISDDFRNDSSENEETLNDNRVDEDGVVVIDEYDYSPQEVIHEDLSEEYTPPRNNLRNRYNNNPIQFPRSRSSSSEDIEDLF